VTTRNGKAVAVLLAPTEDHDPEGLLLARTPRFRQLLAPSRESIKRAKGLSRDHFWKMVAERTPNKAEAGHGAPSSA
jgi:hypothetical protein